MGYSVNYDAVLTQVVSSMDLSMDYIANVTTDVRVYKNGSLLALNADYTISNIVQFPYYTTFTLNFVQAAPIGASIRIEKNEDWNQWIQAKFPTLEPRIEALENKLTTADNVALRLTTIENALITLSNSISTLATTVSNLSAAHDTTKASVLSLGNLISNYLYPTIANMASFVGLKGSVVINNNQSSPVSIADFLMDGNQFSSIKVDYEIIRSTGDEYRTSVGSLYLVCKDNGVWYTERGLQVIDLDGVSFSINTIADRLGQLQYTSDLMTGGGYTGVFKYRTIKFEV